MKKTEKSNTNEIIEIPAEEAPYALPDGWKWVRQSSVCNLYNGEEKSGVSFPYLEVKYLRGNKTAEIVNKGKFIVKNSKVILVDGENSGEVFSIIEDGYMGSTFKALNISKVVNEEYLLFFICSKKDLYRNNKRGSAIPHLDKNLFFNMPFPLPPLETQKRIVERIESLFAKLDEAKEKAQTALDTFELRKSAILHKAFTGELTAQWREENNAVAVTSENSDNLTSTPTEGSNGATSYSEDSNNVTPSSVEYPNNLISVPSSLSKQMKQQESDSVEQYLTNSSLPNGWLKKCFADVANIKLNLVEPSDYPNYPHIAPDSIEKKTGVLLTYRTVAEDKVTSAKHRFYPGQILYSKIRPYLSKVVIIDFDGLCSADMYPIEAVENTRFLWYYMLSDEFLNQASNAGSRTVLPKINQKELAKISVSVPPLPEQQEIVRILDDLLAKENAAKEAAEAVIEKIDLMKKSILARAFRGEL